MSRFSCTTTSILRSCMRVLLLGAIVPALAAAQQRPPADTLSPQQRAMERLRTLPPLIQPDTTQQDSTELPDSLAPEPLQRVELVGDSATRPRGIAGDSISELLMRLAGYTVTQYGAPVARYDADSAQLSLIGESQVERDGQQLEADSLLVFYENTGFACGFGKPLLTGGTLTAPLTSDSLCYDIERQIGRAYGVETTVTEGATWFVKGQCWTVGTNLYCHDTMFTDCELKFPHAHYRFEAGDVKVVRNNVMVARDVTLKFADVPVFWLPIMVQSLERGRRSGLLFPEFSINDVARTSSRYSRRVQGMGVYWAINDYMGAEVTGDWWANNYTSLNLGFDYNVLSRFLRGGMTASRYWRDDGQRELTLVARNSWQPNERTTLNANGTYSTSTKFIEERSFDRDELRRTMRSDASVNRRFDWGSASLGVSRDQNLLDNTTTWKLPGVSASLSPITLFEALPGEESWFSNLTWSGSTSFTGTRKDIADDNPSPTLASDRGITASVDNKFVLGNFSFSQKFDLTRADREGREFAVDTIPDITPFGNQAMNWSAALDYQQRLIGTSTLTPTIRLKGGNFRSDTVDAISQPLSFDLGATLRTDLFGFFPGVGPFERVRHRLSPSVTYNYSPEPTITPLQRQVFNSIGSVIEANALSFQLSQTFEAKYRAEEGDTADTAADSLAAAQDTATGPRRREQSRVITLLSLSTSAINYDFVKARELDRGFTTTMISNSLQSDLLRGFQFNITHDLFRDGELPEGAPAGQLAERDFDPFLRQVSASFSLSDDSWIGRLLGGGNRQDTLPTTESPPQPAAGEAGAGTGDDPNEQNYSLMGKGSPRRPAQPVGPAGAWNASISYSLARARRDDVNGLDNQMIQAQLTMQPTTLWALNWRTAYNVTESQFSDHTLTLTRRMHDWDANFDFIKAQNGNFSFNFRVNLRANPDLKFDYSQRDLEGRVTNDPSRQ